jgi:hypothetical protein
VKNPFIVAFFFCLRFKSLNPVSFIDVNTLISQGILILLHIFESH